MARTSGDGPWDGGQRFVGKRVTGPRVRGESEAGEAHPTGSMKDGKSESWGRG